jgi:hypothetical protein
MRQQPEILNQRFPLRRDLLVRASEQGLEGDIARRLAAGVTGYAALNESVGAVLNSVAKSGVGAYMPLVASLRPLGSMWVEATRADGSRYGLLRIDEADGSLRVRHVEVPMDGQPAWCIPASISVMQYAKSNTPKIDWHAVRSGKVRHNAKDDARWMAWANNHLALEMLTEGATPTAAMSALGSTGIQDLVMLALAVSPLVSPGFSSLLGGHDA